MTITSELVAYHPVSPDPVIAGCQNTGHEEDGVVFLGIEPLLGAYMFIGRQSLLEAMAVMYQVPVSEVDARLSAPAQPESKPSRTRRKES